MRDYQKDTIDTYNTHAKGFQTTWASRAQPERVDEFLNVLSGKKILDVGCGSGRDVAIFVGKGYDVVGIDLSEAFIQMGRTHVPDAVFEQMDVLDLTFEDETFDGVWASAILLHLMPEDIPIAMKEIYRVLKPGGIFRFSVKKGNGARIESDIIVNSAKRLNVYFQKDEIERYACVVGFEIIQSFESKSMRNPKIGFIDVLARK
jgi:ubiquinone/menaquinone biosynthesis C-methylase UbiE